VATKKNDDVIECGACGFPNKIYDSRCIYCSTPLSKNRETKETGKMFNLKSRGKTFANRSHLSLSLANLLRLIFYLAISTALLIGGVTLFYLGIRAGSFLYILLGLLLSLYGGSALYNFLKERGINWN